MAVKILWYLTTPDGPYPWEPEGRWNTDFEHLKQLAIAAAPAPTKASQCRPP